MPFDLNTARKIQAGEIEGKIKTQCGDDVRVLCIDDDDVDYGPQMAAIIAHNYGYGDREEHLFIYDRNGFLVPTPIAMNRAAFQLILLIPDNEPQFKPFDRVIVRDYGKGVSWLATLFSDYTDDKLFPYRAIDGCAYARCIPFEGNEELVGTTNEPNKED